MAVAPDPEPQRRADDRWGLWDKRVRDIVLFSIGTVGLVNELFWQAAPRVGSLPILAGILGFPLALRADERRRKKDTEEDP